MNREDCFAPGVPAIPVRRKGRATARRRPVQRFGFAGLILSTGLGGCIQIAAPEEPIVIELNINIRQEVIYRLSEDASNTIEENSDIF
jgi:hypothetical protein